MSIHISDVHENIVTILYTPAKNIQYCLTLHTRLLYNSINITYVILINYEIYFKMPSGSFIQSITCLKKKTAIFRMKHIRLKY